MGGGWEPGSCARTRSPTAYPQAVCIGSPISSHRCQRRPSRTSHAPRGSSSTGFSSSSPLAPIASTTARIFPRSSTRCVSVRTPSFFMWRPTRPPRVYEEMPPRHALSGDGGGGRAIGAPSGTIGAFSRNASTLRVAWGATTSFACLRSFASSAATAADGLAPLGSKTWSKRRGSGKASAHRNERTRKRSRVVPCQITRRGSGRATGGGFGRDDIFCARRRRSDETRTAPRTRSCRVCERRRRRRAHISSAAARRSGSICRSSDGRIVSEPAPSSCRRDRPV